MQERLSVLKEAPLLKQPFSLEEALRAVEEFY